MATVTLNRPEKLNAWTVVMAGELREALARADADDGVRAIVITGAGRGFCAGADMSRLAAAAAGRSALGAPPMPTEGLEANFAQRLSYILAVKKPILAAINGPVAGVGLVVTFYCDMRFMAAGAKLTTAFARRGLIAEHGIAWLLPRLIGPMNALDLLGAVRLARLASDARCLPSSRNTIAGEHAFRILRGDDGMGRNSDSDIAPTAAAAVICGATRLTPVAPFTLSNNGLASAR